MGNCECSNRQRRGLQNFEDNIRNKAKQHNISQPVIFDTVGFILIDYTKKTFGMGSIEDLRKKIENYKINDVRCCRDISQAPKKGKKSADTASFVEIMGFYDFYEQRSDLTMIVELVSSGFKIEIGEENVIKALNYDKNPRVEYLYIPNDSDLENCTKGFHEVIEWVYEKSEENWNTVDVTPPEDENLSKNLYDYIVSFYK
ncbi:unnamed protein product [Blepharisma stoltei]|uniref:Uncharacterized protein n=1 Tax=Blepharisma stoltei TaxID=1481888 RepID=A0AAU9JXN3_9CILI|nr:unnamed protein product [Blepharisma stoltei]